MTLTDWSDDFLRGQLGASLAATAEDGSTLGPAGGLLMTLLWGEALRRGIDLGPLAEVAPLDRPARRWAT